SASETSPSIAAAWTSSAAVATRRSWSSRSPACFPQLARSATKLLIASNKIPPEKQRLEVAFRAPGISMRAGGWRNRDRSRREAQKRLIDRLGLARALVQQPQIVDNMLTF